MSTISFFTNQGRRKVWKYEGGGSNPRPFEGEGFAYIPEKIGGGGDRPPSHSSDGPATLNWPTPSRFDFFSFATLKFNFGENVCTCQRICPAHHMFSRKTNYELSPIFYGQETNYVFLLNCYYVSMTL